MSVSLREVTRETLRSVCRLDAGDGATQVAPNAVSIAEASFYDEAWFRVIYDDDTLGRFYSSLGFKYTGKEEKGERVMALEL